MLKSARQAVFLALFLMCTTLPAVGQESLAEGVWTGTAYPPDQDVIEMEFNLWYGDDGLEIEIVLPPEAGMGTLPAEDVEHEADLLSFTLNIGEIIECALYAQDDGHYEGDCTDSSGSPALVTMFPPEN